MEGAGYGKQMMHKPPEMGRLSKRHAPELRCAYPQLRVLGSAVRTRST